MMNESMELNLKMMEKPKCYRPVAYIKFVDYEKDEDPKVTKLQSKLFKYLIENYNLSIAQDETVSILK